MRWRAKHARAVRHARVLSRFWHTSQGLIWQVRAPPCIPMLPSAEYALAACTLCQWHQAQGI